MRNWVLLALLPCFACGGSDSRLAVSGTIGGQPMAARDAVSSVMYVGSDSEGLILVTDAANACAKFTANQRPRNARWITIGIGTQTGSATSAPVDTGDYIVHSSSNGDTAAARGKVAIAVYAATDANCVVTSIEATSGKVTLTRVDANGYAGTFDITFMDGSHVTGRFDASTCATLSFNNQGTCT